MTAAARPERAFVSRRVVAPGGTRPAAVLVRGGKIEAVVPPGDVPAGIETVDYGDLALLPGVVDTHVHVNEPGRTEWEGFDTATAAAAAGGITTIVDMPLNCIPVTTSRAAFAAKQEAIAGKLHVDTGFWGGVVPGNARELAGMVQDGVLGFKCFLIHSGIDDFPNVVERDLATAMPILAGCGVPLLVHAELDHPPPAPEPADPRPYAGYLGSRPGRWEAKAIELMVALATEHRCRTHVVHLSAAEALPIVRGARAIGAPLSVETCPHYLTLEAEAVPDGATAFKCAPPIRDRANRDELWKALSGGAIDFVVSDHSPCTPELKLMEAGDFMKAWGGISSVQLGLPVVWTEARRRGIALEQVVDWMCRRTAGFAGLAGRKGVLAQGADADLVAFDPEGELTVEPAMILHRHKITPYTGKRLAGRVKATWLGGRLIAEDGRLVARGHGRPLLGRTGGSAPPRGPGRRTR